MHPEVAREKLRYGVYFGATVGTAFAVFTWGWDAYLLYWAHGLFPWIKLAIGLVVCGLAGAAAGGSTARLERSLAAVFIWLAAALVFAWLVVALPLQIAPRLTVLLQPDLNGLVHYDYYEGFSARYGIALTWVAIFSAIVGLLQLPTSEAAVFSTSLMGKAAPAILCIAIMGISGWIVDSLNNEPLRTAVISVNETIQFAVDHRGQTVDQRVKLRMHLGAVRRVEEYLDRPRNLVVGSFDQYLGEVNVLVRFGDVWVNCLSIYNQPSFCQVIDP